MLLIMKPRIKIADILIILLAAGLTLFSAFVAYMKPQKTVRVLIQGQDQKWTFPLDVDETVVVSGPLGDTVVRIRDNHAWVESSPCENQTCVAAGLVRRQGAWAACLPNNVLLMMEGTDDDGEVDTVAW